MASSRVKKSIKNVTYGLVIQAITVIINFAVRIVLVRLLGKETNGLNGLFTEVIAMLSLAEMGVGSAITYSLYKPLADNDTERLSRLMWLFKQAYRVIAVVVTLLGVLVLPFIQFIIKDVHFELSYIRLVFMLFVLKTSTTYLFSYRTSLLMADQKNYVVSVITVICKAVLAVFNIIFLLLTKSFVVYIAIGIVFNFITNFSVSVYAGRQYPFLKNNLPLQKEERKKIFVNMRHIFVSKLSSKVTNSTDNILISALVSTVATGVYNNYALIITSTKLVAAQIMGSITGSLGNLLATEKPRHCSDVLKRLIFVFFVAGFIMGGGLLCASRPFIEICFGKDYLLDNTVLFICAFNLYLFMWINPLWNIMSVAGLFSEDKKTSVAGTVINLIVSFILGKRIGMAGIFIGTTCTIVIQIILKSYLLYTKGFGLAWKGFILSALKMTMLVLVTFALEFFLCLKISVGGNVMQFILTGCLSTLLSCGVIFLFYGRSPEFIYYKGFIGERLGKIRLARRTVR